MSFIRHNQRQLRADAYHNVRDAVQGDNNNNLNEIGRRIVLPATFIGSPRYYLEKTHDAFALANKFGSPDLFITFTCNPKWPELRENNNGPRRNMPPHTIIARVFNGKLKRLIQLIFDHSHELFGEISDTFLSPEWQKRGLPHAHILVWLKNKIPRDRIDSVISAELPSENEDGVLYNIVKSQMIHTHNDRSACS